MALTVEMFEAEIQEAMGVYDRCVVCLEKAPADCGEALHRLVRKAIDAFEGRAPHLRHGIALDGHVTVILSQSDGDRPLCGIYFNLHSPYRRVAEAKKVSLVEGRD
jgi:hypothetical protein